MKGTSTFSKPPVFGSMLVVQGEDFYKIPNHFCADVLELLCILLFSTTVLVLTNSPEPHSVGWCLPVGGEG